MEQITPFQYLMAFFGYVLIPAYFGWTLTFSKHFHPELQPYLSMAPIVVFVMVVIISAILGYFFKSAI